MTFSTLGLSPLILEGLKAAHFLNPTDVQRGVIPAILERRDVQAIAPTGTGKTAAYVLPLLEIWQQAKYDNHRTLVLVPTRELAQQVGKVFVTLSSCLLAKPKIIALYGGISINPQLMRLSQGMDFIIATPGRLLDVLENNGFRMREIHTFVLDEADRLLELGFSKELDAVVEQLPPDRQTLLFSAMISKKSYSLANRLMHEPVHFSVEKQKSQIRERAIAVDESKKVSVLLYLLKEEQIDRGLVFCASKVRVEELVLALREKGLRVEGLYGDLPQNVRSQVLFELKAKMIDVLVATDVAARGIDIPALPLVVNYDLPRSPLMYTQRIGRTGRAEETGLALSLVEVDSLAHFALINKRLDLSLSLEQLSGFLPTDTANPRLLVSDTQGGIKGKRPSKKDKIRAAKAKKRV